MSGNLGANQPQIVSDGTSGAILAWREDTGVYAQRVISGFTLWGTTGLQLSTSANVTVRAVPDGFGGAIVAWFSNGGQVFVQHVGSSGTALWSPGGVSFTAWATELAVVSDGAGGAILAWADERFVSINNPTASEIYAQRIDAAGNVRWTSNGVPVSTAPGPQFGPCLTPDGSGGAIIAWSDFRIWNDEDVYAQRVDANGTPMWTLDGVQLSDTTGDDLATDIASDGSGGAIVALVTDNGVDRDVSLRAVDHSGFPAWSASGTGNLAPGASGDQTNLQLAADGAGGVIAVWEDYRADGINPDIYATRVGSSGAALWMRGGVAICEEPGIQRNPRIVPDGAGGAVIVWEDWRAGNSDIFAQHVDAAGNHVLTWQGIGVCTQGASQTEPTVLVNTPGTAIVAWTDWRSGSTIYAHQIDTSPMTSADETPSIMRLTVRGNSPNPFNVSTEFQVGIADPADIMVDIYDVTGRRVRALQVAGARPGWTRVRFDGRDASGNALPSGVYFYRVRANGTAITRKMLILR